MFHNRKTVTLAKKQQGNLLIISLVIIVALLALGLGLSKVLSGRRSKIRLNIMEPALIWLPKAA
ncbi:hypothetical protein ACOBV9_01955 [Pseudoalteromonas espejiana]